MLLMLFSAPVAEVWIYPRLVIWGNTGQTIKNIATNQTLFGLAILGYFVTFTCDLVVAWALYIFLRPVHEHLSILAAAFRFVYGVLALVA